MPETLLARLKRTARLPTPPGTALEILRLCQQDDISISALSDTLAADPALSVRLLKYANSAMLGVRKEVTSVRDAVLLLGVRSVRLMALSFSLLTQDDDRACKSFDFTLFWSHSLAAAVSARHLSRNDPGISPEEAFAAGLLSQIGKLAFAVGLPEEYAQILSQAGGTLGATAELERKAFDTTHYDIGADLLADWSIPERLVTTIRFQRKPEDLSVPDQQQFARLVGTSVDLADLMCQNGDLGTLARVSQSVLSSGLISTPEELEDACRKIQKEFEVLAATLKLRSDIKVNAKAIQAEAGEVLGELSLATQLKSDVIERENQTLQEKAWTDGLTGIANRAAFDRQLSILWEESLRHGRPLALVLLDVDHFKKFNDTYGHRTGDAVLRAVARVLPRAVRQVDFVARYGGEEFAIIMPRVDRLIAAQICVKVRKMIEMSEVDFESQRHRVTVSVGSALISRVCRPYRPHDLLEAADKQLYASKGKGRNCCSMRQIEPGRVLTGAAC